MIIRAAREITDGDIVFCGTGISSLAAMAAKRINAPNSVLFFESGAIDSALEALPASVADPRVMYGTAQNATMLDSFSTMQNKFTGDRIIGILGAAQIDKFGNINTTCIGDYHKPQVRFPGSGGGCDVSSFVNRRIVFMQHGKRKFVKKLDYHTSPGFIDGPCGREKLGLMGDGPTVVITNMAVMTFHKETKEMVLHSYYQGVTPKKVLAQMEFDVDISNAFEEPGPTDVELNILRNEIDAQSK